jgi:hypothetical protein
MSSSADAGWAEGVAPLVFEMLDNGASDDDVERFLRARQDGDTELSLRLQSEAARVARPSSTSRLDSSTVIASRGITVAALRPVVNELTAQELQYYIYFVQHASKLLVETHAEESIWASPAVVEAAGSSLRQAALKWLRGLSLPVGPS